MSKVVPLFVSSCLILSLAAAAPSASAAVLDLPLEQEMLRADATERIPVVIMMDDPGFSPEVVQRLSRLDRGSRRAEGSVRLRNHAAFVQADLLAAMERLVREGRAESPRPLLAASAVAARVTPSGIRDLLLEPGVRIIRWDPPVPEERMVDRGPEPAGGWGAIQGEPGRDDPQVWWQLDAVNAPECWSAGYDGSGVIVAVLDSGVDYEHPDLAPRIFSNSAEIPGNAIDDDENGFVDDVRGWDFVDGDNDPMGFGVSDHGTLVAGIVAGDGTSGIRTGVAPGATILPIRVVGASWSAIFEGIDYAILMGADIIQMSVSQKWRFTPKPDFAAWRAAAD